MSSTHHTCSHTGFTLIELLAAVSLILVAFSAIISLFISTTYLNRASKNKLIAANLAQEGMELVRNIRDTNWIQCQNNTLSNACNWGYFVGEINNRSVINSNKEYFVQFDPFDSNSSPFLVESSGNTNIWLCTADEGQAYITSSSCEGTSANTISTPFSRLIKFTENPDTNPADSTNEIQITATVTWTEGTQSKSLILTEYLYPWK